jgi:hypothetical protein
MRAEYPTHLVVNARDFTTQNVHVSTLAVGAYLLLAVDAYRAIGLLRANVAPLHDLAACWVWKFACYLYVKFQEPLQGHVGGETLHSLIRDPVFCTTFWALNLQQYRATVINCPHQYNLFLWAHRMNCI